MKLRKLSRIRLIIDWLVEKKTSRRVKALQKRHIETRAKTDAKHLRELKQKEKDKTAELEENNADWKARYNENDKKLRAELKIKNKEIVELVESHQRKLEERDNSIAEERRSLREDKETLRKVLQEMVSHQDQITRDQVTMSEILKGTDRLSHFFTHNVRLNGQVDKAREDLEKSQGRYEKAIAGARVKLAELDAGESKK